MSGTRSLLAMIEERIATGRFDLPARSQVATELHRLVADPDVDLARVAALIGGDAALTGEVLRAANSALYAGLSKVATVREASVRLGTAQLLRVAVQACEKQQYCAGSPTLQALMEPLWQHSRAAAHGAAWLARKLGYRDLEQVAFVGGLLHDVGKLLLIKVIDDVSEEEGLGEGMSEPLVLEILDSAHTTRGFDLARAWGLPDEYALLIRDHHLEDLTQSGTLLNLVSLANKACRRLGIGIATDPSLVLAVTEEAATLGAGDIVLAQLMVELEDLAAAGEALESAPR